MSDSQEKSDDLIAELAKLMASSASGTDAGPKPTVIKLPPLNEATVQASPVRIPGMDSPKPAPQPEPARSTAPMGGIAPVRIPGMDKPAGIDTPPAPKPAAQFDFGRPPPGAPVIAPEPMSNWDNRDIPKVTLAQPTARPATVTQLASMKFDPAPLPASPETPAATRLEPRIVPASVSAQPVPAAMSSQPVSAPAGDSFNFDFGFSGGTGTPKQPPAAANDPIADLIVAELDAAEAVDEHPGDHAPPPAPKAPEAPQPGPVAVRPVASAPRSVTTTAIPIKPVSVTPRSSEGDRFSMAPAFGAKSNPAPAPIPHISTARADLDPMDEIESLIGEAVRVELTPSEKPAMPVVPPLNTSFAPRRTGLRDTEPQVQSAESAILAAAAASGSDPGRLDSPHGDDRPYKRMKVKPPKTAGLSSGARQYVGIAVAGTLLLAAGFGLYWVLGMGRDDPSTAPVLTADITPAKVEPLVASTTTAEPTRSVVFDEIDGASAVDDGETLVSRDETAGEDVREVASVPAVEEEEGTTESGLANRKVRTVTVRPDGTIVSGEEAVAGAEELPVERPNVPQIEGAEVEPSDLMAAEVAESGTNASAAPAAGTDAADPINALVAEAGEATTAPLADPAPLEVATIATTPAEFDGSLVAPIPMPRPIDRSALIGNAVSALDIAPEPETQAIGVNEPASTPLVAIAEPAPAASTQTTSRGGGAYVQLSSQRSESDAAQSLRTTESRMAGTLQGAPLEIRRVDLGAKGVWYRVVMPVDSFQDATQTCAAIKSNGGDCVAING